MQVKVVAKKGCQRVLSVSVPSEATVKRFDEVYLELGERAEIPGFRKGRIPREVLEARFAELARQEVAKRLIPGVCRQAIHDQGLEPVSLPQVSQVQFNSDQGLSFTATFDVKPQVKVKQYKGLKVKRAPVAVGDEEVNQAILTMQEQQAQMIPVEGRAAQEGDWLLCDLEFAVGQEVLERRSQVWLALDSGRGDVPVDQLIGVQPQEVRSWEQQFPKDSPHAKLAGLKVTMKVKVHQIKLKRLPELNDEFAKAFGDFVNLQAFKDAVRRDLLRRREAEARRHMERDLIDQLVRRTEFDLPQGLVEEETDRLVKSSEEELKRRSMSNEEIQRLGPTLKGQVEAEARRRVKTYFILDWIAQAESIQATDAEVEERLAEIARSANQSVTAIRDYLERENRLASLRQELRQEKIMERLLSEAKVEFE